MNNNNFQQPGQAVFGNTPVQAAAAPAAGAQPKDTGPITITEAETGTAFFVHTGGNEQVKEKLKELGGIHNSHIRAYKFPARDMPRVIDELTKFGLGDVQRPVGLVDPRKVIEVTFDQKFQYPGDIAEAEAKLKELGMTKKAGRSNAWTGDLAKAGLFLKAFGISH